MICNLPCRFVLITFNVLTSLAGVALLTLGALMVWGKSFVKMVLIKSLEPLIDAITPESDSAAYTELVERILTATSPIGKAVFVIGCIILVASVIGYVGACCNTKFIYYIYEVLLVLLATTIVAAVIVYYVKKDSVADYAEHFFSDSVVRYQSMNANNLDSLVVGFISPMLNCCGINNGSDFLNMSPTDVYDRKNYTNLEFPVICCKMDKLYRIIGDNCPEIFTFANSNFNQGCREPLRVNFIHYMDYAAIGMICVLGLLLLLIAFTTITLCFDFI